MASNRGIWNKIYTFGIMIFIIYSILFGSALFYSFYKDSINDNSHSIAKICCNNTNTEVFVLHDSDKNSFESIEKVSATFGAIVAVVVGYYFGHRDTERLTKDVEDRDETIRIISQEVQKQLEQNQKTSQLEELKTGLEESMKKFRFLNND